METTLIRVTLCGPSSKHSSLNYMVFYVEPDYSLDEIAALNKAFKPRTIYTHVMGTAPFFGWALNG